MVTRSSELTAIGASVPFRTPSYPLSYPSVPAPYLSVPSSYLSYHPPMHRDYHSWHSDVLHRRMEMLTFGHAGQPVFVFPTSMGAFFEYEDRGMVQALAGKLDAGALRLFCVQTVDQESFYAQRHPRERIERYLQWERSLLHEMVPFA